MHTLHRGAPSRPRNDHHTVYRRRSVRQQWSAIIAGRWLQLVGMTFLLLAVFTVAGLLAITVAAVSSSWWM